MNERKTRVSLMQLYLHRAYDFITFKWIFSLSSIFIYIFPTCHYIFFYPQLSLVFCMASSHDRVFVFGFQLSTYCHCSFFSVTSICQQFTFCLLFKWFPHFAGRLQNCYRICATHKKCKIFTCFGTWRATLSDFNARVNIIKLIVVNAFYLCWHLSWKI